MSRPLAAASRLAAALLLAATASGGEGATPRTAFDSPGPSAAAPAAAESAAAESAAAESAAAESAAGESTSRDEAGGDATERFLAALTSVRSDAPGTKEAEERLRRCAQALADELGRPDVVDVADYYLGLAPSQRREGWLLEARFDVLRERALGLAGSGR